MILWNVNVFLMNLRFSIIDIQFAHKISERQLTCDLFNDKDERINILLISLRITVISINL